MRTAEKVSTQSDICLLFIRIVPHQLMGNENLYRREGTKSGWICHFLTQWFGGCNKMRCHPTESLPLKLKLQKFGAAGDLTHQKLRYVSYGMEF